MTKRTPKEVGLLFSKRRKSLRLSQANAGASSATVGKIERAQGFPYDDLSLAKFATAIGWPADAYQQLLDGVDPESFPERSLNVADIEDILTSVDQMEAQLHAIRVRLRSPQ